jgi:NADPH2:quinone reductase
MLQGRYPGQPKFPFVPGYDFVGHVSAVGSGVDPQLIGRRVAVVTKTGAWTTHAFDDARSVVTVPDDLDPAAVETVVVKGITAWQMLHRKPRFSRDRPSSSMAPVGEWAARSSNWRASATCGRRSTVWFTPGTK